jgi:hypothetical protein
LAHPLEHYSLEISSKCPGGKINDARGAFHTHTHTLFPLPLHRRHRLPGKRGRGTGRAPSDLVLVGQYATAPVPASPAPN